MKLLIKQRIFAWTDTYDVYDENYQPKYFVRGQFFSLGHVLRVADMAGREIGSVRERIFSFLPKFEIEAHGRHLGLISRQFTFFRPRYAIDFKNWMVQGDILGWNYEVFHEGKPVVHIGREFFHWGDTYVLDIAHPQDEIAGLLLVLAIDAANCSANG